MSKSAGSGYRSPIDIGLGRMPKSQNAENFAEMVEVYNAVHILNAYLDSVRGILDIGKEGSDLDEQIPFRVGFWGTAGEDIQAGEVVHTTTVDITVRKGIIVQEYASRPIWGLALMDAKEGESIQVGMPPAVIKVEGAKVWENLFAAHTNNKEYRGKILRGKLGKHKSGIIGAVFAPGYAYLYSHHPY